MAFNELEKKRFGLTDEQDGGEPPPYNPAEIYADFQREYACTKFLGELYKVGLFAHDDLLRTIFFLLEDSHDEMAIEMCCILLKTTGKAFDNDPPPPVDPADESEDSNQYVAETTFGVLEMFAHQDTVSNRVRNIIQVNSIL